MEKINFRDILAIIFILLAVGIFVTGIWVVADCNISDLAGNIIAGAIGTFGTLLTLVIQFYFRKKPSEKEDDKT
jgi:hypothetical protein